MKKKFTRAILFCSMATPAFLPNLAFGESDNVKDADVESVTIIGLRQAYQGDFSVREIPQAELEIDAVMIRNAGALDLNQALDLSASVARQNNFGGLWNSFALRGFVGDENLPSNYLVNGFNAGRGFGGPRDLSGIESVEVLKGPRAALFGRGEPGGTINLVTKRAKLADDTAGELRLLAGSFDTYRTDVDVNVPVFDTVAVRLVGFYEDADSFRDTVETQKQGLSPSVLWRFNDQSQLSYELEYSDQELPFDRGVFAIDNELGTIPENRFYGEPGDGPIETDVLGHQIEFQHDFNEDWSLLAGANFRDTSLEGFASETRFTPLTSSDETVNRFRRYRDYDASYQVFRAEISGSFDTGSLQHRIIIGTDVDKFENDQLQLRIFGDQEINITNPVYGDKPLPLPNPRSDTLETQESLGVYLQDQISLTDKLDVRLGLRFDDYEQEFENRRTDEITEQTEDRVSPQLGIVYEATDVFSIYAAYGENFRPLSGGDFEPNQTTSIEAGIKFELNNGALVGTATIFRVEQENILGVIDDIDFVPVAIGEAESQGFEFDVNGQVTDSVSMLLSYAYIDAEVSNGFVDGNFGRTVSPGAPLLNIPEHQLSLQLVKATQLSGKALEFGGGLVYVGERNGYFGQDFELPSYTTARAFVAYEPADILELRLDIDNLFDEEYYSNSFADVWVQPGAPLNARLSAIFQF